MLIELTLEFGLGQQQTVELAGLLDFAQKVAEADQILDSELMLVAEQMVALG